MSIALRRRGIALAWCLTLIGVMATVAWIYLNFSEQSILAARRLRDDMRAYQAAEAGIRLYLAEPEHWSLARDETHELAPLLRFRLAVRTHSRQKDPTWPPSAYTVSCTGTSGRAERTIRLLVSLDGDVESRSE